MGLFYSDVNNLSTKEIYLVNGSRSVISYHFCLFNNKSDIHLSI